jgi:hypothetical protein
MLEQVLSEDLLAVIKKKRPRKPLHKKLDKKVQDLKNFKNYWLDILVKKSLNKSIIKKSKRNF